MTNSAIRLWIVSTSFTILAHGSDLPPAAQELASKLEDWEGQQRAALEERIDEKRHQVVGALNAQLENVTKKGDLDGALAIRKYIESIERGAVETARETVEPVSSVPAAIDDVKIPKGAHRYKRSYFMIFTEDEPISWMESSVKCQEMGGRLVSVESEEKWDDLYEYLEENRVPEMHLWLGASRKDKDSPYFWPNGEELSFQRILENPAQEERLQNSKFNWIALSLANTWAYKTMSDPYVKGFICEWEKP